MNYKLIEAVKTIKSVCESNQYNSSCCKSCPFGDSDGECLIISSSPDGWRIIEDGKVLT